MGLLLTHFGFTEGWGMSVMDLLLVNSRFIPTSKHFLSRHRLQCVRDWTVTSQRLSQRPNSVSWNQTIGDYMDCDVIYAIWRLKSLATRFVLNSFLKLAAKNTTKICIAGSLCDGIHRWQVDSPHKGASHAEDMSLLWHHHEFIIRSVYCRC